VVHREQREMRHQALVRDKGANVLGPGFFGGDVACTLMAVNWSLERGPSKCS
jgi:hypothetical protein